MATNGDRTKIGHGAVVIAAITSCTNTSNPTVMVGAGLLAQKAVARPQGAAAREDEHGAGLKVVTEYLHEAGLVTPLEALGFHTVGYGCTTCIAAGTPVLRADGTACPIEEMPATGGVKLLAPNGEGRLAHAVQTEMMVQGVRDCVSLVLQDGRTLLCTPDHEILCANGSGNVPTSSCWVRTGSSWGSRHRWTWSGRTRRVMSSGPANLRFTFDSPLERQRP